MSDINFGLISPATDFYALFSTFINQENQFKSFPLTL